MNTDQMDLNHLNATTVATSNTEQDKDGLGAFLYSFVLVVIYSTIIVCVLISRIRPQRNRIKAEQEMQKGTSYKILIKLLSTNVAYYYKSLLNSGTI